jgi:outer membrane protein TolC
MLSWRLDYGTYSTAQAQAAAADVQTIQAERTRRNVADTIFEAYHRVEASIAKSRSARAEAESAQKAAKLSSDRYQAGAVTQLDVTQSQRDAFQAVASRIKADADLAYARVLLRIAAGKPATVPASTSKSIPLAEQTATPNATTDPPSTSAPVP